LANISFDVVTERGKGNNENKRVIARILKVEPHVVEGQGEGNGLDQWVNIRFDVEKVTGFKNSVTTSKIIQQ
jgi:hypothetical protein